MIIVNRQDLMNAYRLIRSVGNKKEWKPWMDDIKRKIREYTTETFSVRLIKEDLDGYVVLKEFPSCVTSEEEAEEWFESEEKILYIPSAYDCTGRAYTSWHKVFQRHGKWMFYHGVGLDV